MIVIKVRGEASAQGVFDACYGLGVRWTEPNRKALSHVIRVDRMTLEDAKSLLADLNLPNASVTEET